MVLQRDDFKDDGVFGRLMNGNVQVAATLEHAYDCAPKIPPGFYQCVRGQHALEDGVPFETFEITGIPGHSGLLFHCGNFNRDSKGCVLLGMGRVGDTVVASRIAFGKFMELQSGVQEFCLQVIGG